MSKTDESLSELISQLNKAFGAVSPHVAAPTMRSARALAGTELLRGMVGLMTAAGFAILAYFLFQEGMESRDSFGYFVAAIAISTGSFGLMVGSFLALSYIPAWMGLRDPATYIAATILGRIGKSES